MFKYLGIALAAQMLIGCQFTTTNYLRNQTNDSLSVSVQQGRSDLGWSQEERENITLKPNTTCNISTDPYYDSFLYIENPVSGNTTNISVLEHDEYIYAVSTRNDKQVVTISEADSNTIKTVGKPYKTNCVRITNEQK